MMRGRLTSILNASESPFRPLIFLRDYPLLLSRDPILNILAVIERKTARGSS